MVELLAVITIIMILAALVIGAASIAARKGDTSRCRTRMSLISKALEEYKLDYGKYPNGSQAVLSSNLFVNPVTTGRPDGSRKPYLADTNSFMDPWGNTMLYTCPGSRNVLYDLWSKGPDGQDQTGDDLNNWSSDH